jgi:uncharacterized iron-regulated membrane protein
MVRSDFLLLRPMGLDLHNGSGFRIFLFHFFLFLPGVFWDSYMYMLAMDR